MSHTNPETIRRLMRDALAPLDPALVKVGDTVTVRVESEPGIPVPFSVTGEAHEGPAGLAVGGFPLGNEYVTLTDHQPAPEPEWKPGTVAVVTVDHYTYRAIRSDFGTWVTGTEVGEPEEVTDVRPLVVIDPAAVDVDALVAAAHTDRVLYGDTTPDQMRGAALRMLAVLGIEAAR